MPPQNTLHSHSAHYKTRSRQISLPSRLQTLGYTLTKTNAAHTAKLASTLQLLREEQIVPNAVLCQQMEIFANMLDEDRRLLLLVRRMQRTLAGGWASLGGNGGRSSEVVGAGAVVESDGSLAPGVEGLTLGSGGEMEGGEGGGGDAEEMAEEMAEDDECEGGGAVGSASGAEGNGAEADGGWEGVDSSETVSSSDGGGVAL